MLDGQFDAAAIAGDYTTFREIATNKRAFTKCRVFYEPQRNFINRYKYLSYVK